MVRKVQRKPVRSRTKKTAIRAEVLSVSKKVAKKAVKAKDSVTKKIQNRIHAKLVPETKRVKITITDNTVSTFVPKHSIIHRSNLQLAPLSPFRFPILRDSTLSTVARYTGVFFVIVGGFFSLFNLQYLNGTATIITGMQNLAQTSGTYSDGTTLSGGGTTSSSGTTGTYTDPYSGTTNTSGTTIDTTPDVRVAVEMPSPIKGMTPINVNVPMAIEVKLLAELSGGSTLIQLGMAFRIDDFNWRFYWDTRQYPDGEYRIRVIVKNVYGSYEHQDSTKYLVDNIPDAESAPPPSDSTISGSTSTTTSANTTTSTTSSTTTWTATTTSTNNYTATTTTINRFVNLYVRQASPLQGGVRLEMSAADATGVQVHAKNTSTAVVTYAGAAVKGSDGIWRLDWNTKSVIDGNYVLRARGTFPGGLVLESTGVERSVKNGITTLTYSTTTTATTGIIGTTTNTTSTTTTATTNPVATTTTTLKPTIDIRLAQPNPVSGFADILVKTSPVLSVELYAIPKASLTVRFLGLAQRVTTTGTDWKYSWQTTQSPNGDYDVYARVKTDYGFTDGSRILVKVLNSVVTEFTAEQEQTIDTMRDVNEDLVTVTEDAPDTTSVESPSTSQEYVPPKVVYVESVSTFMEKVEEIPEINEEEVITIEEILSEFRKRLNVELNNLARAEREGNEDELRRVKESIEDLRADVIKELRTSFDRRDLLDNIDGYLTQVTNDLRDITLKNEQMLKERVGEAIVKDSDKDGIGDYDEVNLYRTNPFAADTDGDSYIDSIEIKLGYDPLSPKSESLVVYESPKEVGIIREDILTVETITTLAPTEAEQTGEIESVPTRALISGKGLPNSFVTLYIFSTPIVLTVKTDAEGAWSYVFDKELDEGEHEVYVGITDNAGRIVAKSAPLPFVKTAVAFNEKEGVGGALIVSPEPTLISERALLVVASIAIAGLGLVLILLGLHVRGREETPVLVQAT